MKRVTLKDVAEMAGVTTATVSYVLNETPGQRIAEATRDRVMRAARDLNYVPNTAARALRSAKTRAIGVAVKKNLAVPRYAQTLQGIQSMLETHGYSILLCSNALQGNGQRAYVNAYLEGRVDGVIFLGRDNKGPSSESKFSIRRYGIPFVIFDCQEKAEGMSAVDYDYEGSARALCDLALRGGSRRVLYVRPQMESLQERLRERGVREACARRGIPLQLCYVPVTEDNVEIWDGRYSMGETDQSRALGELCVSTVKAAVDKLDDGDLVLASWAAFDETIRVATEGRSFAMAELANNGERRFGAQISMRLPNYRAGEACAEEVLRLIEGETPRARIIDLVDFIGP